MSRLNILLRLRDFAVSTKLPVKNAELSTKCFRSNDDGAVSNAEQRLKMLPSAVERKVAVAPTAFLRHMVNTAD